MVGHRLAPCCQDFPHTLNIVNYEPATGQITGTGTQPDFTFFGDLSGSNITLHIIYSNSSYFADLAGTVASDGSMSGTFTDNLNQSGTWTAMPTQLGLSWGLVKDFSANPTANPARDSYGIPVWRFMQSSSFAHDLNYSQLPHYSNQFAGVSGLDAWYGDVSTCFTLPEVGINTTLSTQIPCTVTIPASTVFVHPANPQMAIVGWQSPTSGTVTISGGVADDDATCGDGIRWYVDQDAATIASGAIPNGGSASFPTGLQATVHNGTVLYFIVDPGASGDISCDTTRLDVTILAGRPTTPSVVLSPATQTVTVGSTATLTATLSNFSAFPFTVAGIFSVISGPVSGYFEQIPIACPPLCTIPLFFTGSNLGADTFQLSISSSTAQTLTATAQVTFAARANSVYLTPQTQDCPVSTTCHVTATVMAASGPAMGVSVSLMINGIVSTTSQSDASGQVRFPVTSSKIQQLALTASAAGPPAFKPSNTAYIYFTPAPTPITGGNANQNTRSALNRVGILTRSRTSGGPQCTATVVQSPNRSVIVTAAHCLGGAFGLAFAPSFNGPHGSSSSPFYTDNLQAAPASQTPYGVWNVGAVFIPSCAISVGCDEAFLVLEPNVAGQRIADVLGGGLPIQLFSQSEVGSGYSVYGYDVTHGYCAGTATHQDQQGNCLDANNNNVVYQPRGSGDNGLHKCMESTSGITNFAVDQAGNPIVQQLLTMEPTNTSPCDLGVFSSGGPWLTSVNAAAAVNSGEFAHLTDSNPCCEQERGIPLSTANQADTLLQSAGQLP
jgi:hypothetical protein